MNLLDPSMPLLAASGGDTVKLFDVSIDSGDPCTFMYTPSPGCIVNSVKWNHTNLVVASAGEDKKISLWRKNGQIGTVPISSGDGGDGIEESILAINFSNKGSRYMCSGGSGQIVRIWDLQRKLCIKWLKGHTSMITGAMYNCKDEHMASIGANGDLILHKLASSARGTELKDPNQQVLRVLDCSRTSRHLLVTAGDDGTVHLWDTTGRSPKVSWLKQHSAPTAGITFAPSNDKIIASVGLDQKLYMYDSGSKKPATCIAYDTPFSSLAYKDDGWVLAAGTINGRVVFYDVRGKPQPFTVLRAYNSEAVTSLCWQRSKPIMLKESNCSAEAALLGGSNEDSILMPDPLPSATSSNLSVSTSLSGLRNTSVPSSSMMNMTSSAEETPTRSNLWPGGTLTRLHSTRTGYNYKDEMSLFSPVVEVQPITPVRNKLWDNHEGVKEDLFNVGKKPSASFSPSSQRFSFSEDVANVHLRYDRKSSSSAKQDDTGSFTFYGSTSSSSSISEDSSITPPEAWGGEKSNKVADPRQTFNFPSRFGMPISESLFGGPQAQASSSSQMSTTTALTNSTSSFAHLRGKNNITSNYETSVALPEDLSTSSISAFLGTKGINFPTNVEAQAAPSLTMPRRSSTYEERIRTASSFSDGTSLSVGSPKNKKTGAENRDEPRISLLSRPDSSAVAEPGIVPTANGGKAQDHKSLHLDPQQGSSFSLQLFRRALEETIDSFQKSIRDDTRNLHIEILRQFHMQEVETTKVLKTILENQAELMEEVKSLRKENQQLRQLL